MSSRYQDRDREEGRYSREEPERKDRGEERRRKYEPEEHTYRSPRRDGDRERDRDRVRPTTDRARSRSPKREAGSSRYDERDDRDRRGRGPNDDPNYRAPRNDQPPSGPARGVHVDRGRGGYGGRGGGFEGRGGGYGGRGGGGGGYGGRGGGVNGGGRGGYQQAEYDRPLDRRAIEEGRRKREEERAMGLSRNQEDGEEAPYPEPEEGQGDAEAGEEEEVDPMAAMMGFGGFGTTKNKSTGQYEGATSNVHTQRTWRQYMNRRGGFNRALDKVTK